MSKYPAGALRRARGTSFWGEEGILSPAPPRLDRARPTVVANPSPHFHPRVWCVAFATRLIETSFNDGAHPLVMDALAEMSEAQKYLFIEFIESAYLSNAKVNPRHDTNTWC